jgi:hypothetical protein
MMAIAHRRPRVAPTIRTVRFPAPTGGINTVDVGAAMPKLDSVYCYNMLPAEYGLRVRLGYKEWATGLTTSGNPGLPTLSVMPFSGSTGSKLFAATASDIFDCSTSMASPPSVLTFASSSGDAGIGNGTVASTIAGRFLLWCDEENGLHIYTEGTDSWTKVSLGTTQSWAATTSYLVGNKVINNAREYVVTVAGISAGSGGPTGTGTGIADGAAQWNYVGPAASNVIGPSLADQQAGFTGDPAGFVQVCIWKSRVWLVEKDSSRAWYLPTSSIYGTATSFDFGQKMRSGGTLRGLFNWSYDNGFGMDTLLVGISSAGDVVIYQGSDPSQLTSFGVKGSWTVGGVPAGRRIATDYGGELLILSTLGIVPLSKLIQGASDTDASVYATKKIANTFNVLVSTNKTLQGWGLYLHPTDNSLLVTTPTAPGAATTQLAMSMATHGWAQYRDLPINCAGVWDGQLYFGTADGRVCINDGYVDDVLLADTSSFSPVAWSVLTRFDNLKSAGLKRAQMTETVLLSQTPNPTCEATVRYDFNFTEPAPPTGSGLPGDGTWDSATWDTSVWGGDYAESKVRRGAIGIGRDVGVAVRGSAVSRTTLIAIDLHYDMGGLL